MTWRIIEGDCRDMLRTLPAQSVHTVVTSPPYFGLRDYGTDGQIGLEPTPDEFVAALVDVFRGVRRVLRDDGTVWLNLGDSYNAHPGGAGDRGGRALNALQGTDGQPAYTAGHGLGRVKECKPKNLLGIPWMVAFALRADGWYLRSDIIWSKPNPMPESVTDRPTKAHEYVFLLSKGPRYFYDADAIREEHTREPFGGNDGFAPAAKDHHLTSQSSIREGKGRMGNPEGGRNKRSVWTVATTPFSGCHFATFPPKLIEPCILAGAPERVCGECGAPWVRVVERGALVSSGPHAIAEKPRSRHRASDDPVRRGIDALEDRPTDGWGDLPRRERTTLGFEPSCSHGDGSASGVVLDPFAGSGTTGLVALRHNRSFIGIELSSTYAAMARERIVWDQPLFNQASEVVA